MRWKFWYFLITFRNVAALRIFFYGFGDKYFHRSKNRNLLIFCELLKYGRFYSTFERLLRKIESLYAFYYFSYIEVLFSRWFNCRNLTARLRNCEDWFWFRCFYDSQRHLDKGSDLAEAASASGLRELARSLKQHLRGFGSRLEDRREYLEDTSRCCLLQDRAYEWAHEARMAGERRSQQFLMARPPLPAEHFTEMIGLAEKLGNDVLLEQCRIARSKCTEALEFARSVSALGSPARRRSLAPSESATSWDDGLGKRENNLVFFIIH